MKPRILPDALLAELAGRYGTPLYVQDGDAVAPRVEALAGFDVVRYSMKANSNLAFLRVVRAAGAQVDCVSAGEILRALAAGWGPGEICYTADLFDRPALELVGQHAVAVNLGSADMLEQYAERVPGGSVTLRVNPGFGHGHDRKVDTGGEHSKHGIWHAELPEVVERARRAGLEVGGLHMHIGSGSDYEHLAQVAGAMVNAARAVGPSLGMISSGGGLPVPYRPGQRPFDTEAFTATWQRARARIAAELGRRPRLEVEPGRFLCAEGGLLLAEVRAAKTVAGRACLLIDAGFHTLARPMMYGAYHQISIVGRDGEPTRPTVVAGPLCEAADVLTQDASGLPAPQPLPAARPGDLVCLHDTGAYGASMASNYNSMPIAAEVLLTGGVERLVRPRQAVQELLRAELACLDEEDATRCDPTGCR